VLAVMIFAAMFYGLFEATATANLAFVIPLHRSGAAETDGGEPIGSACNSTKNWVGNLSVFRNSSTSFTVIWDMNKASVTDWIVEVSTNPAGQNETSPACSIPSTNKEYDVGTGGCVAKDTVAAAAGSDVISGLAPQTGYYVSVTADSKEGNGCNKTNTTVAASSCDLTEYPHVQ
jgi:hypothetical protein